MELWVYVSLMALDLNQLMSRKEIFWRTACFLIYYKPWFLENFVFYMMSFINQKLHNHWTIPSTALLCSCIVSVSYSLGRNVPIVLRYIYSPLTWSLLDMPTLSLLLSIITNTQWREQITKLKHMHFSPQCCYFLCPTFKYSPHFPVLKFPQTILFP
jgi:hypothetical protein